MKERGREGGTKSQIASCNESYETEDIRQTEREKAAEKPEKRSMVDGSHKRFRS